MKKRIVMMAVAVMIASVASASLTTTYYDVKDITGTAGTVTQSVTVATGDMVVFAVAGNKKDNVASQTFSASGGGGTFSYLSAASAVGNADTMNAMIGYYTVVTGGTYDFIATTTLSTQTATVGLYLLHADSGLISPVSVYNGTRVNNAAAGTTINNNFINMSNDPNFANYGGMFNVGVAAMNGSGGSYSVSNNVIAGYSVNEIDNGQRAYSSVDSTGRNTSRWVYTIDTPNTVDDFGSIHMAFAEVIPEPATLGVISITGLAVLFIRRRFMM